MSSRKNVACFLHVGLARVNILYEYFVANIPSVSFDKLVDGGGCYSDGGANRNRLNDFGIVEGVNGANCKWLGVIELNRQHKVRHHEGRYDGPAKR